jgi:hypothetical protein
VAPNSADKNLFDARADESNADAESSISFGAPELPVVLTIRAVFGETSVAAISVRARAGPSETRAFAIRAINSPRLHAGSTVRTSLWYDLCSIARVGYRP